MNSIKSSANDSIIKKDLASSFVRDEFSETKIDLAAESVTSDGDKLVTVPEEPEKEATSSANEATNDPKQESDTSNSKDDDQSDEDVIVNSNALERSEESEKLETDKTYSL